MAWSIFGRRTLLACNGTVVLFPSPGSAKVVKQGYLALAGNNLTYPGLGVRASGRG